MVASDRNGTPATAYPDTHLSGVFLGINGDGLGEYLTDEYIFLAEYTAEGLEVPPKEFGMAHEFYLDDITLGEYIAETTREFGSWAYLTETAKEALANAGYDAENHVEESP
jgi:hypothetical protein